MNTTKIQHISGLESMSDSDLRSTLQALQANPVANVNWAEEFPYAPEVSFKMAYSDKTVAILIFAFYNAGIVEFSVYCIV